jgi:DNA-directed RNA polymerase
VVQEFTPEVMAITAVCCAMRALSMTSEVGYRTNGGLASRICLSIGARLREQMEYDRYARSDHPSLAAFASRYPEVNRRVWARWRRKLREVREAPWPLPVVQATGGLLLRRLCDVAPDRFTLSLEAVGRGHRAAVLLLSQETVEMLNDIEERAAVARPMLLPMRVPPIPWRYQE